MSTKYSRDNRYVLGEESRRHERREVGPRSEKSARDALRASRDEETTVPREYAVRLRAASPGVSDADLGRLHGHIPVEYAASALRRGMSVDAVIEAYQEHAPRSTVGAAPQYQRATFIPARKPTRASQLAAAVAALTRPQKE